MSTIYLSPTSIANRARCSLASELSRLHLRPRGEPSMKMRIGSAFHDAWEQFTIVEPEKRSLALLTTNIGLAWDTLREESKEFDEKKWTGAKERSLRIAEHYWKEFGCDESVSGGFSEHWMEMPIVTLDDTEYVLRARIDYVTSDHVHEMKTTGESPHPRDGTGYTLFLPQLQLEGLLLQHQDPTANITTSITCVWPSGADRFPIPLTTRFAERAKNMGIRVANSIHSGTYHAGEGYWCGNCEFRDVCEVRLTTGVLPKGLDKSKLID